MFFCDPPGHSGPEHVFNFGRDDIVENSYVFFHDQEPVELDLFSKLFMEVIARNMDLLEIHDFLRGPSAINWSNPDDLKHFSQYIRSTNQKSMMYSYFSANRDRLHRFIKSNLSLFKGDVVVSERGENVKALSDNYGWNSHYYFYHGWACLDWFRGYDRTFLIPRATNRTPTHTFMSPNRIIAGRRDHRVLFLYHLLKHGLQNNYISAPRTCPVEDIDIITVANKYYSTYTDIKQVLDRAELPRTFTGEDTQQMTSCWLSNFAEAQDSLVYVPTETVFFGRRTHITEKTFKAIALEMPFVLIATAGSLEYLREYGFQTFNGILDESYDTELDDLRRVERVVQLLKDLDNLSVRERQQIHRACLPIVEHNYNHFYRGGLTDVLWTELTTMLNGLRI